MTRTVVSPPKVSHMSSLHLCSKLHCNSLFVCLFVCLFFEFFVALKNVSLIWRRHHCRWRAANFDLCSAHMAIEQWGFFSVPHLLKHGSSFYNCHLRGPVTLTPNAERLAVELYSCFNDLGLSWLVFNTQPSTCGANALIDCDIAAVIVPVDYYITVGIINIKTMRRKLLEIQ